MHDPDMSLEAFDERRYPRALVAFAWVLLTVQLLTVCGLGVAAWAGEWGAREAPDPARCRCWENGGPSTRMERYSPNGVAGDGKGGTRVASAAPPVETAVPHEGSAGATRNNGDLAAFLAAPHPGLAMTCGALLMEAPADEEGLWVGALRYIVCNPAQPRQQAAVTVSTRSAAGRVLRQHGAGHRYAGIRTVWPATVTLAWSRQSVPELQLEQVLAWGFLQSPAGPEDAAEGGALAVGRYLRMVADEKPFPQD